MKRLIISTLVSVALFAAAISFDPAVRRNRYYARSCK
jgi:hypothetical protein